MIKSIDSFLILLALAVFSVGLYKRIRLWRIGKDENRSAHMGKRIKSFFIEAVWHRRILRDRFPGAVHLAIFLGFTIPLLVVLVVQVMFTLPLVISRVISLLLDLIALSALTGISIAIYRRYIKRPERLDNKPEDITALLLILAILITGMVLEGLRLSVIGRDSQAWAPLGNVLASIFNLTGLGFKAKGLLATVFFRIHFFLVLATIAYIPYSKLFHIISSSLNTIYRSLEPKGSLAYIDLEDEKAESFGVAKIEEFTWKHLMDLDACTRCGRCQDFCPAFTTEKPLSPKKLITDLKNHMHARLPQFIKAGTENGECEEVPTLIGSIIDEDVLWTCTTCRSCMEHCPVFIEHVDKIIDMRRYQVLMESKFPNELMAAFRGLENNSNPWGLGADTRADWVEELNVPILSELEEKEIDFLFYVGCIRSYDDRNKRVSQAMIRILNHLGSKFAILGMEEGCCGDPARRVGNEYLYQILAQTNIETFNRYKIKKILTTCPHCYNTLKNEYSQLGFKGEIIHHSQFLHENINNGRLKISCPQAQSLTYHDPCYLGRYNDIYLAPRNVIESASQANIVEMKNSREDSFCCGAGGGWMWMDEKIGKRINLTRLEDILKVKVDGIATACPFCVTMFHDAIKDKELEGELKVWDIAEIAEKAIFGDK